MYCRIFLLLALLIISCNESKESKSIIGSWKLKNIISTPPENFSDKTTFFEGDSATIEILENGKTVSLQTIKYSLDARKNILTTSYEGTSFNFEVLKLNESELELRNNITKKIDQYIKIN